MVTYKGSLFDDEKEQTQKLLKVINQKVEKAPDQLERDFWNEKRVMLERKLLEFEYKELESVE